jgi:hypothetical protein
MAVPESWEQERQRTGLKEMRPEKNIGAKLSGAFQLFTLKEGSAFLSSEGMIPGFIFKKHSKGWGRGSKSRMSI